MKYVVTDRDIKEKLTLRQAKKFKKLLSLVIDEQELTIRIKKSSNAQIISKLLDYYEDDSILEQAPFSKFTDYVAVTSALDFAVDYLMEFKYNNESNCLSALSDFYVNNYCINDKYLYKDNHIFEDIFPTYDIKGSLRKAIEVLEG